ncbi:MAG: hypothetical protein V1244_07090, partial [Nitrospinaceae bacterium]|nr:hypothetical protein [Nitrospinaceae bacterium]
TAPYQIARKLSLTTFYCYFQPVYRLARNLNLCIIKGYSTHQYALVGVSCQLWQPSDSCRRS